MQTKPAPEADNQFIAEQLLRHLGEMSYRKIASITGYNPETVRRYLCDNSKISASFVRRASIVFGIDSNLLLLGKPVPAHKKDLRQVATQSLLLELANRFGRIEETVVGMSLHDELYSEMMAHQNIPTTSDLEHESLTNHEQAEPPYSISSPAVIKTKSLSARSRSDHKG